MQSRAKPERLVILDERVVPIPALHVKKNLGLAYLVSDLTQRKAYDVRPIRSNLANPLRISSVVHWHKDVAERFSMQQANQSNAALSGVNGNENTAKFKVDDVEMFVANNCPADYYVVL